MGQVSAGKRPWKDEESVVRDRALAALYLFCTDFRSESRLGEQLRAASSEAERIETFRHVFRGKAPATLAKRWGSLKLFARWHRAAKPGYPVGISEDVAYSYARALISEGAPPTRLQSFVEALRFVHVLLGLPGSSGCLVSPRLEGAAIDSMERKRVRRQRAPLPVRVVAELEAYVSGGGDVRQRILAGQFLFLVHTRFRYSDAVRISVEPTLDELGDWGFIETIAKAEETKTGKTKRRRGLAVSVVGLSTGVLGLRWAAAWLEARKREGLSAERSGTLFPYPSEHGGWSTASATLGEANAWIRAFAAGSGIKEDLVANLGTHSCKATLLSWAAKYGLRGEHRRRLGGHSKADEKSVLEYSRDALAVPLEEVENIFAEIRPGTFDPDATRSGRRGNVQPLAEKIGLPLLVGPQGGQGKEDLPESSKEKAGQVLSDVAAALAGNREADSNSSLVDSSSCDEENGSSRSSSARSSSIRGRTTPRAGEDHDIKGDDVDEITGVVVEGAVCDDEGRQLYSHKVWGTLHRAKEEMGAERFPCGVAVATANPLAEWSGTWTGAVCCRCFR